MLIIASPSEDTEVAINHRFLQVDITIALKYDEKVHLSSPEKIIS